AVEVGGALAVGPRERCVGDDAGVRHELRLAVGVRILGAGLDDVLVVLGRARLRLFLGLRRCAESGDGEREDGVPAGSEPGDSEPGREPRPAARPDGPTAQGHLPASALAGCAGFSGFAFSGFTSLSASARIFFSLANRPCRSFASAARSASNAFTLSLS